jgi:tRNA-dihydrouridine synthase A
MDYSRKSFAVAPMLDLTDRHCRAFLRLFSPRFRLYTEMVVMGSIIHGDRNRFLGFSKSQHPVALQLGGNDPEILSICSKLAEERGYDEINLNIGCPSDRVKSAQFGACLMANPELVANCIAAMSEAVSIPVTVKTRLGIDDEDSYGFLVDFVGKVADAGCRHFLVHARKAWLSGLSPKENRSVPPLQYERVYRLKQDFPDLRISLNGGVSSIDQMAKHLQTVDGVMIGREAYQNPWIIRQAHDEFFPAPDELSECQKLTVDSRVAAVYAFLPYIEDQLGQGIYLRHIYAFLPYIEDQLGQGIYLRHMTRHMLGLFHGQQGAKCWRRYLSEHGPKKNAGIEVVEQALKFVTTGNLGKEPALVFRNAANG